jgi:beta-glucosidase
MSAPARLRRLTSFRPPTRHASFRRGLRWLLALTTAASMAGLMASFPSAAQAGPRAGAAAKPPLPVYLNTSYSPAERAADLVSRMTLAEKVQQLRTNSAPAIPRLGVQEYTYWNEGQHGLNTLFNDLNNGGATGGVHATSFPTNFASTMSWDPQLVYGETTAISDEARGELDPSLWGKAQNNLGPSASDYGALTFWAPTVNMDRDPRWGRTDESFGEDPYLQGQMAGAFVNGYEGNTMTGRSINGYLKVAATAKHYALNDNENNRHADSADTTDANIRDYYTAQFRSLIEKDHVSGVMTSYNAINGTPAPADTYTANELLQRTYGFGGYTTSDCGAVGDVYSSGSHDWAPPGWTTSTTGGNTTWTNSTTGQQVPGAAGGQAYAVRAGTDLNCTGSEYTLSNIEQAIKAGILSEGVIDNALTRVFTIRMETGEFDPRSHVPYTQITKDAIQSTAHQALARKVADEDLVLLKNDNVAGTSAPLLPADPSTLSNVVIVGNLANQVTLGDYSGDPSLRVSAVQGITDAVKAANPSAAVTYDSCGTSTTATTDASCSAQTLTDIKNADLVLVFAGTDTNVATEGKDRTTLAMPGNYDSLISQVAAQGNPRTALVLQTGGPVTIDNVQQDFPSIVFSGYNGESQGSALADVLFGKQDPAGHLDFTWYSDDSQLPPMKNYGLTPSQTGGTGRTYMYFTGKPTYPFGYGLSYTHFTYSAAEVTPRQVSADGTVLVSLNVTNAGSVPGSTVAQVYAVPPSPAGSEQPQEELRGFQKTEDLRPGQTQHIVIRVKVSDLSHWDQSQLKQVVADGAWQFRVASDASDVQGAGTVKVSGAITPRVQYVTVQPDKVEFQPGDTLDLAGKNPWIANDTSPSLEQPHATADNIVEAVNNDQSFVHLDRAKVRYRSSNPNVASVSPDGKVTMNGHGAASINVTVNGVTGSTPVVVKPSFTMTAPQVVTPGNSATVTTSLPSTGGQPLKNVGLALTGPSGWTVTATTPDSFKQVPPGQTATTTWQVTPPAGVTPGPATLNATATFTDSNGEGTADSSASISVPYPSFTSMLSNPGISDDASPSAGNLDGGGASYSAETLAAAGITPGASITHDGLTFTWPSAQPGQPDNAIAGGQAFAISGSGSTLGLLGSGTYGDSSGTGTVIYTDGTTQQFSITLPDWWSNTAPPGGDILASFPYINNGGGKQTQKVSLYYEGVPLQPGKTVQYVTLPNVSQQAVQGSTAMHVFAVAIGG